MELVNHIKEHYPSLAKGWHPIDVKSDSAVKRMNRADRTAYLTQLLRSYHKHSFAYDERKVELCDDEMMPNTDRIPELSIRNGAMTIKMFTSGQDKYRLSAGYRTQMTEMLAASKRLVIDLTKHEGGTIWSGVDFLKEIVGDASLFSFDARSTKIRWLSANSDDYQPRKKTKLAYPHLITIRVSRRTASSGEILAIIFDRPGPYTIKGKSKGYLSSNETMTWYGVTVALTTSKIRSINRIYHDEIIDC